MKSILLTSKSQSNNLSLSNANHHLSTTENSASAESFDKEHYNKLFSNSKKQVIRSRCNLKSEAGDKLKRNTNDGDSSDGNVVLISGSGGGDGNFENQRVKKNSDNKSSGYFSNLENYPLIVDSASVVVTASTAGESKESENGKARLINVKKKNGTTLIFQKKSNTQKHLRSNEYQELESFKKRRSLQWSYGGGVSAVDIKTDSNNRHSWYDTRSREGTIQEEFDSFSPLTQFTNNLAEIKKKSIDTTSSILGDGATSNENVPELISMRTSIDNSMLPMSGTTTTTASTRRWRIEQFLKNLVGKKPSAQTSTTITVEKVKRSPSEHDLLQHQKTNHQLGASVTSLNKERLLNKSTASLNSTSLAMVHQKLWSVVPLLNRKDGNSCSNLLPSRNVVPLHGKMRKCETVLALTNDHESEPLQFTHPIASTSSSGSGNMMMDPSKIHSKSINSLLEPIKPLNRLRNSQSCYVGKNSDSPSSATAAGRQCSRCSSLLSLAAIGGSNYSLNVTNSAFVLKNNKKPSAPAALNDDLLLISDNSNSSHNLIGNDFNEIEPYNDDVDDDDGDDDDKADDGGVSTFNLLTCNKGPANTTANLKFTCKLCLGEYSTDDKLTKINSCGCSFCTECMKAYVEFEISEGAYELSCPDALCSSQGIVSLNEVSQLASSSLVAKHHRYRLNREVELDKYRLWCPNRNCETICSVGPPIDKSSSSSSAIQQQPSSSSTATLLLPRSVLCPTCNLDFCSSCKKAWHPSMTCEENSRRMGGGRNESMMLFDNDLIKCCPMCAVPIEKDEGCAQMMCKRCKHVFCWYCLASLDDDFLLRHYDKGPCKNKLGHSRASVVWHRAQVIGIFAGFGILLLVASPLLLLAAPCIVCCKCKIEESTSTKLEENDDRVDHQV